MQIYLLLKTKGEQNLMHCQIEMCFQFKVIVTLVPGGSNDLNA